MANTGQERQRILVVCYGNICRSPTAEALLRRALQRHGLDRRFLVRSAGVGAQPGTPAARGAVEAARAQRLDLTAHRARRLTAEMAREADVVIALDEVVEEEISILAGDVDVVLWAVDDPYGGSEADYQQAFAAVETYVEAYAAGLKARAAAR